MLQTAINRSVIGEIISDKSADVRADQSEELSRLNSVFPGVPCLLSGGSLFRWNVISHRPEPGSVQDSLNLDSIQRPGPGLFQSRSEPVRSADIADHCLTWRT